MKYSYEFKLRAVKYYLKTGLYLKIPIESTRHCYLAKIRKWVALYKTHGKEGLKRIKKHKVFSVRKKLETIKKYNNGYSFYELSIALGIEQTVISNWAKQYKKYGIKGLNVVSGRGVEKKKRKIVLKEDSKTEIVKRIETIRSKKNIKLKDCLNEYKIASSTYYYNRHRTSYREKNHKIYELINEIFTSSGNTYGVVRMKIALKNEYGLLLSEKKIRRIMRDQKLKVILQKSKYKSYKGKRGEICDNIIHRNFKSNVPLKKITTDITEFEFPFGKVFLQPYLDMYNGEILCFQLSKDATFNQTRALINKLISKYKNQLDKTIFHSDQGWQYQTEWYQNKINELGCFQSMSKKGNCLDNAIMENFFGRLKMEIFYGKVFKYKNFNDFKKTIEKYIVFYNNKRVKTKLKMSPVQYRLFNNKKETILY